MHEIRFRGKRKDGGWEYGLLSIGIEGYEIVNTDGMGLFFHYPVDPSTVGQYTGLNDKNGVEIYEGDIVLAPCAPHGKDKYSIKPHRCEVFWSQMGMPGWDLRILDYEPGVKWARGHLCLGREGDAFEVIGNIHDNPELLKEVVAEAREGKANG